MSDQKRETLTPFGKSDKKSSKQCSRNTFRLSFSLSDPSDSSCAVFNYESAVHSEEKKLKKKKQQAEDKKKTNGVIDPFDAEDDEDVKRLARKFEEKYGDKNGKCKSYAELGAGYDETDPFIDNTEAFDETLEENDETPCGGYYINSGPLQIRRVEVSDQSDADDIHRRRLKKLPMIEEDEDVEDEEEEDREEEDVEEEEGEDEDGDADGDAEEEEGVEAETKSISAEDSPPEVKKENVATIEEEAEEKMTLEEEEPVVKKKKKRVITDDEEITKPKKAKTVKTLLEEKRTQATPTPTATSTAEETKKPQLSKENSLHINEAIESVVNAGNHNENSNHSTSSTSAAGGSTSHSEDSQDGVPNSQNSPLPLPEMSSDLLALVEKVKQKAKITDNTRKTFHPDINDCLIKIEWKSIDFSTANRNLLYAHLAEFLPCKKDTLMRRAKKLFIYKEENKIDHIICRLKATIDSVMPSVLESYTKDCQRIAAEKGVSVPVLNSVTPGEEPVTPEIQGVRFPKRRYRWTDETRGYLKEIVDLKLRCYKVLKTRKNSQEEYMKNFLNTKVKLLWPQGWMKLSTLLREFGAPSSERKSSHRHSSHNHSHSKGGSSRSTPTAQPATANEPLYIAPPTPGSDNAAPPKRSPLPSPATPTAAARTTAEPTSLLNRLTSPSHLPQVKQEKPEFSMDCLLKRSETGEYKQESVIMNGASLPHVNSSSSSASVSGRGEKVLDLSGCASVIQSADRSMMRASDSVSLTHSHHKSSTSRNEQQHQQQPRPREREVVPERRMSEETTTATDILSQIISESLLAPSQPPLPPPSTPSPNVQPHSKVMENSRDNSLPSVQQELLSDLMRDLKELNHLSGGGVIESKQDNKQNNSYSNCSWTHGANNRGQNNVNHQQSQYHNEYIKHLMNSAHESPTTPSAQQPHPPPPPTYSRHSASPYENYLNDMNKPMYNTSSHRSVQNMASHPSAASNKMSPINQSCIMKPLPHTGISSGMPHNYLSQMEYGAEEQHYGMTASLPYGLPNWSYPGSESESHQ